MNRALKWAGVWLLQIPLYILTSYLVRTLIMIGYQWLIRAGADLPANLLLVHFLWVSLAGGLIAGLIGLQLLRAALLILPDDKNSAVKAPWQRPQAWTWVLPTCWLIFGILAWLGGHASHSVLASSAGSSGSGILAAFFGGGCSLSGMYITGIHQCMPQITFTHPWLGMLGYSAAAFVPTGRFARLKPQMASSEGPEANDPREQLAQ